MSQAGSRPWTFLVFCGLFLSLGLFDLFGPVPNPEAAVWELAFAVANGLFYASTRGAPPAVRSAGYAVFAAGMVAALRDLFF